jgi:ADP-ribosylglycohydrolase
MEENLVVAALLGVAIGDAIGVPFEFKTRAEMQDNPATGMIGYGTHRQPKGTWSDDSSLTFCLAEALLDGYDLRKIAQRFVLWKNEAYWTARGRVFDIGTTTSKAITRLEEILTNNEIEALQGQKNYSEELENGNGSLMRILPLLFHIKGLPIQEQFELIKEVSALTHRHIRAAMSCLIYLKLAEKILAKKDKVMAYLETRTIIRAYWDRIDFPFAERIHFNKIIEQDIRSIPIEELKSGGYVIEVLESSIWFFLQREDYEQTVLSIINLGHDTDTSAAIAGGLAGLYYGIDDIPQFWLASLARLEDIMDLGEKVYRKFF